MSEKQHSESEKMKGASRQLLHIISVSIKESKIFTFGGDETKSSHLKRKADIRI